MAGVGLEKRRRTQGTREVEWTGLDPRQVQKDARLWRWVWEWTQLVWATKSLKSSGGNPETPLNLREGAELEQEGK